VRPDAVIAATGYTHALHSIAGELGVLDAAGSPHADGTGRSAGLVFVGFEPTVTGRLVQIRRQAAQAARAVAAAVT
jgi:putative flavoprotein involved in K+ transport